MSTTTKTAEAVLSARAKIQIAKLREQTGAARKAAKKAKEAVRAAKKKHKEAKRRAKRLRRELKAWEAKAEAVRGPAKAKARKTVRKIESAVPPPAIPVPTSPAAPLEDERDEQ